MPTAPGFAEIAIKFQQTGVIRPAYITFGVDPTGTDPAAMATQVSLAFMYAGSLNTLIDSSVTTTAIRVSYGTDGSADLVYVAEYSHVGGQTLPSALPSNCAMLVRKNTARGGRRGRGRFYVPWCLSESNVDEAGIIAAGQKTTSNAACQVFLTRLGVEGVPMVLLHGPGNNPPPAPDTVLTLTVDSMIGTQRRRLGR